LLDQPHDLSKAPNAKRGDQSEIDSLAPGRSAFGLPVYVAASQARSIPRLRSE